MIDCDCRKTPRLCDGCLEDTYKQLRGVAACRGELAGKRLRRPATVDDARRAMRDVGHDERLLALLASEWLRWTAKPTATS